MSNIGLTKHQQEQLVIEQQLTGKKGYQYYEHSLNLDQDHWKTEGEREIARLKAKAPLTPEEEENLRKYAPPAPDFDVIPEQQVAQMGYFKGKTPRNKIKSYKERYAEWEEFRARYYRETISNIEERIAVQEHEKEMLEYENNDGERLYQDVEADPTEMTKALKRMDDDHSFAHEKLYSQEEYKKLYTNQERDIYSARMDAFTGYMNGSYKYINHYLRTGKDGEKKLFRQRQADFMAETLHEALQSREINRDMVVRRGVSDMSTLGFMMGSKAAMDPEAIKQQLTEKMAKGDVFLRDKGFVSTSVRSSSGFGAGESHVVEKEVDGKVKRVREYTKPGIEFIILVKKGTHALDLSGANVMNQAKNEDELLLDAGTKFRVVKAYFNEGAENKDENDIPEEERVLMGHKGSWKIYLETVPGSENGELRND